MMMFGRRDTGAHRLFPGGVIPAETRSESEMSTSRGMPDYDQALKRLLLRAHDASWR